jgi:hypothetical protein
LGQQALRTNFLTPVSPLNAADLQVQICGKIVHITKATQPYPTCGMSEHAPTSVAWAINSIYVPNFDTKNNATRYTLTFIILRPFSKHFVTIHSLILHHSFAISSQFLHHLFIIYTSSIHHPFIINPSSIHHPSIKPALFFHHTQPLLSPTQKYSRGVAWA